MVGVVGVVDDAAFDAFARSEYASLCRLAGALTGDRQHAEDLVQEVLLRTYQRWQVVRDLDRPGAWARRVLINLATSRARRFRTELVAMTRLGGRRVDADAVLPEDAREFWDAVRALPAAEAKVAALHFADDLSSVDIAAILEIPEGTVRSHLHRARRRLADALGLGDDTPGGAGSVTEGDCR